MIRNIATILLLLAIGCGSAVTQHSPPVTGVRAAEPHATVSRATTDVTPAAANTEEKTTDARKYSDRCPSGMREVEGTACESVTQLCVEGRDVVFGEPLVPGGIHPIVKTVPVHCPNGCPEPYYCDKYLPGSATCHGKQKPVHFCIDDGEYPNVDGELPRTWVTWYEASNLCTAQNKRLCDDDEWTFACEGPEHLPYSYGWERDATACYIDRRKSDGPEPIGASPQCTSPFGVHDMNGNVDEWTVNVTHHGKPFVSLLKGGHWVEGARDRCRPQTESHGPTLSFYAEGFRCCDDIGAAN